MIRTDTTAASGSGVRQPTDTLAYEHQVSVEIVKELVQSRFDEIQAACRSTADYSCTLLDFSSRADETVPSASLRMRVAPTAVSPLIALASKDGRVEQRSTHAEDLAQPIADTERQLALLTTHRDRLTEIMKARNLNVDQLITVSRELSTVQTQIDSFATERANLRRRVDTELLNITLSPPSYTFASEQSPVLESLLSFGANIRTAVASVIRFVALLLPWLVIGIPGLILLRLFWRWITRWIVRRENRGPA